MTERDEATVSSAPQKAHGDALDDVVQASGDSPTSQPAESAESDQGGCPRACRARRGRVRPVTEQLSGMDAAFLALESPELPLHVVGVLLLDPSSGDGWSIDRFCEVVRERLPRMPPFNRRLVGVPLALDRPYWHYEVPDIDDHVIRRALADPGDMHALGALVGEITTELLDRRRPLWQLHVVEGMADGRVALIAKVHHSTLYGAAGAEFIAELLDLSPESPPPATASEPPAHVSGPQPGRLTVGRRTAVAQVRRPLDIGRLVLRGARGVVGAAG